MRINYFFAILLTVLLSVSGYSQLTAPFTESFNSTTAFPTTWTQSATIGGPWIVGSTMGYAASPIVDHTGTTGSSRAWMDFSGTDGGVIMMSDTIDVSALTIPELNFWFNNNLGTNPLSPLNQLYVEVYNGSGWSTLDTLQQDNLGIWSEHFYALGAYVLPGDKLLVRFRAEPGGSASGSAFYHDLAIDDISIRQFSLCRVPINLSADNITDNSATTRWSAGPSTDTAWTVQWGLAGFSIGTGTMTTVLVDSLNLSGLADLTTYEFYVRGYCTSGDTSAWAGPFSFTTLPSCVAPTNQSVTAVTAFTSTLRWSAGSGPNSDTAWSILYDLTGFNPLTSGTYVHVNVDSLNVTGLTPSVQHDFYVRGYCNSGDTSVWVGPFTWRTLCITDTIPYLMDFNTWPPACWDMTGGVNPWLSYTGTSGYAEANFWSISTGDYVMTSTPVYTDKHTRVKFKWSHQFNASYPDDSLRVLVKLDTDTVWETVWSSTNLSSFESNDGAGSTTPGSFVSESVILDSTKYKNASVMVRFQAFTDYGPDLFIDDVVIEEIPTCPEPSLLSHYALFYDSVALKWTNGLADSIWQIEYGPSGFALGSGTTIIDNNDSIAFGGLTPSTTYQVYLKSICKVGDSSSWIGPYTFTTPCSFYTPPYSEDFTSYSFSVNPTCWEEAKGQLTVNSTLSTGTSLWGNRQFANNGLGDNAAVMNIYSTNRFEWLLSPSIDLGSGSTPYQVEFDVAITDYFASAAPDAGGLMGADDKLALIISTDNGVTWSDTNIIELWDTGNMPSFTGDYFYYNLTANGYTGLVRFGLYAESSLSNEDNDAFIDNFAVVQVPTCPRPLGLTFDSATQTTANISWTNGAADSSWILEYGAPGFVQGTGITVSSGTNPAQISGLSASTCYDVYMRSICTAGDSSLWIGPLRFCTDCAPVIDLCEDFEAYSSGLPICWERFVVSTGSSSVQVSTFGGNVAPTSVQMNAGNDPTSTLILISPEMTALTAGTHRATFWLDGSSTPDTTLIIGTMSDPSNPATFSPWDTINDISSSYQEYKIAFDTYTGTDTRIAFLYNPTATFRTINMDDFCFEPIPSCEKAPSVQILNSGIDSNYLNVGWNIDTSHVSYMVAYGPLGYDPILAPAGGDTVTSSSNFKSITGLQPLSDYCIWVKAICTNGDTSFWSGPFCGETGCPSSTGVPYFEDFTSYTTSEVPLCWQEAQGALGGGSAGVPISYGTSFWAPDGFANVGTNGSAKINIYSTNRFEWIVSPSINLGSDPNQTFIIEFDIAMTDYANTTAGVVGYDDSLAFVVSYDDGLTWSQSNIIESWDTSNVPSNTGDHFYHILRNKTGVVKFGFYATTTVSNEDNDWFIDNFSIKDTVFVGLNEVAEMANFKVYPNPNTGLFTVLNEGGANQTSLKVMDIQGRMVYDETYFFNTNGRKVIDVNTLKAGVYVLLIQSEGKLEQHRIIINK